MTTWKGRPERRAREASCSKRTYIAREFGSPVRVSVSAFDSASAWLIAFESASEARRATVSKSRRWSSV